MEFILDVSIGKESDIRAITPFVEEQLLAIKSIIEKKYPGLSAFVFKESGTPDHKGK